MGWGRRTEEIAWHYATILRQSASLAADVELDAVSAQPKSREMEMCICQEWGALPLIFLNYKEKKGIHWFPELSSCLGDPLLMHSWGWEPAWPYYPKSALKSLTSPLWELYQTDMQNWGATTPDCDWGIATLQVRPTERLRTPVLLPWQPCFWGFPLLAMVWDAGAVCPQTL